MATIVLKLKDASDLEKSAKIVYNVFDKFQGIEESQINSNTADDTLTLTVTTKGEVPAIDIEGLVKTLKRKLRKEVKILSHEMNEAEKIVLEVGDIGSGASSSNQPPPATMGQMPPSYELYLGYGPDGSAYAYQQNPKP